MDVFPIWSPRRLLSQTTTKAPEIDLVEADIAAGRLIAPFDTVLPRVAGYYVVTPEATADAPKIALFRDCLITSAAPGLLP